MQLREWNARLHGLAVFRALLGDPVVAKLAALTDRLEAADDSIASLCDAVAAFEAALFAHSLLRMYTMYVQSRGWQLEMLNLNETELGGVKEAIMASDILAQAIRVEEEKLGDSGRILVRPSGTEALIRVMAEAKTEAEARNCAQSLADTIKSLKF